MKAMEALHVYDTTLRDGAQQEGLNLSVSDEPAIAGLLDDLGVDFIEGGWPGANPKDTEFFERARTELDLRRATLAAFGATRRAGGVAAEDPLVRALVDSGASVVCLVAKSHTGHVEYAPRTTREPRSSCSATPTAACSRTRSRRSSPTSSPRPAPASAPTATTTPAVRRPTPSPRCGPGRPTCRAPSTATASAPATPTSSPSPPTSSSSSASTRWRRRRSGAPCTSPTRSAR